MMQFKPVNSKSGNITESAYDEATNTLQVRFKGGRLYEYQNVKPELNKVFESTFSSENSSTGSFFHKQIRSLPSKDITPTPSKEK